MRMPAAGKGGAPGVNAGSFRAADFASRGADRQVHGRPAGTSPGSLLSVANEITLPLV
jgi:hypothetical protein